MSKRRVMIAASGSGGHLIPAMQLARKLQKASIEVVFSGNGLSTNPFFPKESFSFLDHSAGPLKHWKKNGAGFIQSMHFLKKNRPNVVVGFGSYHTFPMMAASLFFRSKLILFEANIVSGRVNALFRPFAHKFCAQFPMIDLKKSQLTFVEPLPWEKKSFSPKKKQKKLTCLVFGGSQSARSLNAKIPFLLKSLKDTVEVIHVAGMESETVMKSYADHQITASVISFTREMHTLYQKADFVISRSGASTIAELFYYQKPALLIPYPYAVKDHQRKNALFATQMGLCEMCEEKELSPEKVHEKIRQVIQKKQNEIEESVVHFNQKRDKVDIVDVIVKAME
jgi:UDP-N-acetylglucosamine--N-acetylmuramyl-(pentapeptide) pyrophosphoryl-undecaprenol N-acetylglucosamine transferase